MSERIDSTVIEQRLQHLARGWSASPSGPAQVFAGMFAKHLGSQVQDAQISENTFRFKLDLGRLQLKGSTEIPVILTGGNGAETLSQVQNMISLLVASGRIVLLLAASATTRDLVLASGSAQRCLVLGLNQIRLLLASEAPLSFLKNELLRTVPLRALIPYDIMHAASAEMFYGRGYEIRRLTDEDSTSFAITGPGKAGKTSLAKQYQRLMKERARGFECFFVDLMECPKNERTALGYASFICSRIGFPEPPTTSSFLGQLRIHSAKLGHNLILILDEVDDLCLDDEACTMIANIARNDLARLLLCGKADLYRTIRNPRSHLANRMEALLLGALDLADARKLLVEPLAGLRIRLADPGSADEILQFTGCFPHLIQMYARRIAEHASQTGEKTMTGPTLQYIRDHDTDISQYVLSPLEDFRDPYANVVALRLLMDDGDEWSAVEVASMIENLSVHEAADRCNELVISNVLTWAGGSFKLANRALRYYARRAGFVDGLYKEALTRYRNAKKGHVYA